LLRMEYGLGGFSAPEGQEEDVPKQEKCVVGGGAARRGLTIPNVDGSGSLWSVRRTWVGIHRGVLTRC
jgi:hypothetical protein